MIRGLSTAMGGYREASLTTSKNWWTRLSMPVILRAVVSEGLQAPVLPVEGPDKYEFWPSWNRSFWVTSPGPWLLKHNFTFPLIVNYKQGCFELVCAYWSFDFGAFLCVVVSLGLSVLLAVLMSLCIEFCVVKGEILTATSCRGSGPGSRSIQ